MGKEALIACVFALTAGAASADGWEYQTQQDKMTSKESRYATMESDNELSLSFPYQGSNHGYLLVQSVPGRPTTTARRCSYAMPRGS
ncbi:hypothetical protein ACPWT1_07890 [Ramlibacter sp. MMS24-I3-19]|uniref:hypothetical protein n=1 Tax=Ramlibacter sp. MMS24-I3-19 TaxID=3416606 RepID=UPI003D00A585